MACNWNKATKKDTEPKMIQNIVIQKKLHSNIGKKGNNKNVNLEEHKVLTQFHLSTSL